MVSEKTSEFQAARRLTSLSRPPSRRCLSRCIVSFSSFGRGCSSSDELEANLLLRDPRRLDCVNGEPLSPPGRRIGLSLLFLPLRVLSRTGTILRSSLPALLGKVDEKARPVDENSSARHTTYAELRCVSRTFGGRRYSTLIPLGRGYPCLIPLLPLPASRRFPLAAGFTPASSLLHHLLLRRRYSFKRLVFPVGTWQPQQRHEKRLINKLIRFRPTPRCTPFVLNLFFFPSANVCPGVVPLAATGRTVVDPSRLPETRHHGFESNSRFISSLMPGRREAFYVKERLFLLSRLLQLCRDIMELLRDCWRIWHT